jgi:hypothetical protein
MVKYIAMLCLVFACEVSYAQEPDWFSRVPIPTAEDVVEAPSDSESPTESPDAGLQQALAANLEQTMRLNDEMQKVVKEAGDAIDRINSFEPVTMDQVRAEIQLALGNRPAFTEDEIREFARDEIKKYHATVKMPNGSLKTIEADSVEVTVAGESGTFLVPAGGVVVEVNGKPVRGAGRVVSGGSVQYMGVTEDLQLKTIPNAIGQAGQRIMFNAPLGRSTCRQVWNPATRRYERVCN